MHNLKSLKIDPKIRFSISGEAAKRWSPIKAEAGKNVLNLFGVVGDEVRLSSVVAALESANGADIVININSPGGDVFEGIAIHSAIADYAGGVTVKVLGLAASAASVIAMAGDKIEVAKSAFFMIHNAWTLAIGNRHDLRSVADTLEPIDAALASLYSDRAGISTEQAVEIMNAETWLNGQQSVEFGFADALTGEEPEKDSDPEKSAVAKMDLWLAKAGLTRSERRNLIKEFKSASGGGVKPSADTADMSSAVSELKSLTNELKGIFK